MAQNVVSRASRRTIGSARSGSRAGEGDERVGVGMPTRASRRARRAVAPVRVDEAERARRRRARDRCTPMTNRQWQPASRAGWRRQGRRSAGPQPSRAGEGPGGAHRLEAHQPRPIGATRPRSSRVAPRCRRGAAARTGRAGAPARRRRPGPAVRRSTCTAPCRTRPSIAEAPHARAAARARAPSDSEGPCASAPRPALRACLVARLAGEGVQPVQQSFEVARVWPAPCRARSRAATIAASPRRAAAESAYGSRPIVRPATAASTSLFRAVPARASESMAAGTPAAWRRPGRRAAPCKRLPHRVDRRDVARSLRVAAGADRSMGATAGPADAPALERRPGGRRDRGVRRNGTMAATSRPCVPRASSISAIRARSRAATLAETGRLRARGQRQECEEGRGDRRARRPGTRRVWRPPGGPPQQQDAVDRPAMCHRLPAGRIIPLHERSPDRFLRHYGPSRGETYRFRRQSMSRAPLRGVRTCSPIPTRCPSNPGKSACTPSTVGSSPISTGAASPT